MGLAPFLVSAGASWLAAGWQEDGMPDESRLRGFGSVPDRLEPALAQPRHRPRTETSSEWGDGSAAPLRALSVTRTAGHAGRATARCLGETVSGRPGG